MNRIPRMKKEDLLTLPVSITSWILLRDYATNHADLDIYKKIIAQYRSECPLFELENLLTTARSSFDEKEFMELIEYLFEQHHLSGNNDRT